MPNRQALRRAPFALRVVQRNAGRAAIIYRRQANPQGLDRLKRIAALSALSFTASAPLLRQAVLAGKEVKTAAGTPTNDVLSTGPYHALDADWGVRVACFAIIATGLRESERLIRAAEHLRHADSDEAAHWLGLLTQEDNVRTLRALRILTEAVQ